MKLATLSTVLIAATLPATEHTITTQTQKKDLSVEGTFVPTEVTVFKLEPEQWSQFKIKSVVDHGAAVKKDDVLISFETEDFEKALAEAREGAKSRELNLAITERELADLEITTQSSLEGLKLAHDRAKESLDDYTDTGRALSEEFARERLEGAKRSLSYQEEELKQLLKMYEEDGVTEETEEIILKRQRASVNSAKLSLKQAEKTAKWSLEKTIPRQAIDLDRAFKSAELAYKTGLENLPRGLELKRLEVAKAKRDHADADRKLNELESDMALLSITSPSDGVIYHGEINDKGWSIGGTPKFLFESGSAPTESALMSLVSAKSPLSLLGSVGQKDRLQIKAGLKGTATVEGLEDAEYPVELLSVDLAPRADGKFGITFKVELPEGSPVVGGMKGKVKLITYQKEGAIVIPEKAISTKDGKSTVMVKMANGKSEVREVTTGMRSKGGIEITEGLKVDQVIVIPGDTEEAAKEEKPAEEVAEEAAGTTAE